MRFISTVLLGIAIAGGSTNVHAASQGCDRTCLSGLLDTYMNAVASHDPKQAPLIIGYRQTENAVAIPLGKGVWQSVTGLHAKPSKYLDPVQGEAFWFGVADEGKTPVVVMARIKVEDNEISEGEWYISRPGQAGMQGPVKADGSGAIFSDPANLEKNPPPVRNVAPGQRLKRNSLQGIANSYFDALTESNPELMQSHPDCFRVENGFLTAGRPLAAGSTDGYNGRSNCQSGLGTFNMSLVGDRRFLAVDEDQQVVVTSAIFLRNANGFQRRCVFFELFYIDRNRISQIYSVIYYPNPGVPVPNWGHYYGNWPLPANFGDAK